MKFMELRSCWSSRALVQWHISAQDGTCRYTHVHSYKHLHTHMQTASLLGVCLSFQLWFLSNSICLSGIDCSGLRHGAVLLHCGVETSSAPPVCTYLCVFMSFGLDIVVVIHFIIIFFFFHKFFLVSTEMWGWIENLNCIQKPNSNL